MSNADPAPNPTNTTESPLPAALPPKGAWHLPDWFATWVATATAILSLVISLYTLVVTTRDPDILLIMPDQVRIAQGGNSGPLLYIQPMFISTGLSERVEVITGIEVQVEPLTAGGSVTDFVWDEQGQWVVDPATMAFNWDYTGDAGPFLVSAREAQFFTGLFIGPRKWLFEAGTYRITLVAERVAVSQPLRASVEVTLAPDEIAFINQSSGQQFLILPVVK